ncbi:MAG: hypothetical protein ACFHU9_07365 [Fluviicola sp.]
MRLIFLFVCLAGLLYQCTVNTDQNNSITSVEASQSKSNIDTIFISDEHLEKPHFSLRLIDTSLYDVYPFDTWVTWRGGWSNTNYDINDLCDTKLMPVDPNIHVKRLSDSLFQFKVDSEFLLEKTGIDRNLFSFEVYLKPNRHCALEWGSKHYVFPELLFYCFKTCELNWEVE